MALLEDIKAYLVAHGAVSIDWPLYIGMFPDDQDQVMALFQTGGLPFDTINRENERPTFQFRVRGKRMDYPVVLAKWQLVFDLLQDSVPTSAYAFVQATHTGPMEFNDEKNRPNFTSNWQVMRSRT